jgi:hypothetical protein
MRRALIPLIFAIATCIASAQSSAAQRDAINLHSPGNAADSRADETASPMKETQDAARTGASEFSVTLIMTAEEAERWLGRAVYGSEGSWLGEIVALRRDPENRVIEIDADIGGFLGIGETRVRVSTDQIKEVKPDGLVLKLSRTEAENLPAIDIP